MLLGLCSSFAVVPMLSVVDGGSAPRRLVGSVRASSDGVSPSDSAGAEGLGALLLANAAFSAAAHPASTPVPPPAKPAGPHPPAAALPPAPTLPAAVVAPARPVTPLAVAKPPAPAVAHSATATRAQAGVASWLDIIPTGTCANNDAPMGALITVTNGAGVSVTCKVVSRGPFGVGRVVDLAKATFARLCPTSAGLVGVSVTW